MPIAAQPTEPDRATDADCRPRGPFGPEGWRTPPPGSPSLSSGPMCPTC